MLKLWRLREAVHDHGTHRVWQRRFFAWIVYADNRRNQKLAYLHNNPVKRGLAKESAQGPWSSWRYY